MHRPIRRLFGGGGWDGEWRREAGRRSSWRCSSSGRSATGGRNPSSTQFPNAVLIGAPNLTVKERLQVLRPDTRDNYYDVFDLVPVKYRELLNAGKVLVTNWHAFAPKSPHREGEASYTVVNKGDETNDAFTLGRAHV